MNEDNKNEKPLSDFDFKAFLKDDARVTAATDDLDVKIKGMSYFVMKMFSELQRLDAFGTTKPVSVDIPPSLGRVLMDVVDDLIHMRTKLKPVKKTDDIAQVILAMQLLESCIVQSAKDELAKDDEKPGESSNAAEIDAMLKKLEQSGLTPE